MKNLTIILTALIIQFCAQNQLFSQTIIHTDATNKNRMYLKTGIEPASNLTMGYERKLDKSILNKPLVSFIELGVFKKGHELKIGGIIPVLEAGKFKVINNLNVSEGVVSTRIYDSEKIAIADELVIGRQQF